MYNMILTPRIFFFFFFNDTATTEIYTLSLHDALPICRAHPTGRCVASVRRYAPAPPAACEDRKSTRLNSSHLVISYAVFCLKKKKNISYMYMMNTYTDMCIIADIGITA